VAITITGTWADADDVLTLTGNANASESDVVLAQAMIEIAVNRSYRASDETTGDYYWLSRAVAFQADYIQRNPAIYAQQDFVRMSQDGFSVDYGLYNGKKSSITYSKLAIAALNNLLSSGNGTIKFNSAFQKGYQSFGWQRIR